jgi:hypothetical protein
MNDTQLAQQPSQVSPLAHSLRQDLKDTESVRRPSSKTKGYQFQHLKGLKDSLPNMSTPSTEQKTLCQQYEHFKVILVLKCFR